MTPPDLTDYDSPADINPSRFIIDYTTPSGTTIRVSHDETEGDTLYLPDGRVLDDTDDIQEWLGDGFDAYWEYVNGHRAWLLRRVHDWVWSVEWGKE